MKRKIWYFQTRLILVQIFLVLPVLALIFVLSFYWIRSSALKAINESRNDSLLTAASSFDQIYMRMIKLLEKPYTDKALYKIITSEYSASDTNTKNLNNAETNRLLNNIIYYEPDIASITLVLDITNSVYYKRRAPSVSVNVHNPDWYNLTQSDWYIEAMKADNYIVTPAADDELYLNSGLTISIVQRLMNVLANEKIGVFRIDIGIENFYTVWNQIVQNKNKDNLLVLDKNNKLIFSSSEEYLKKNPMLSIIDTEAFEKEYHRNICIAEKSGLKFIYLSKDFTALSLKQPLFLVGMAFFICYTIYAGIFIKWSSRYISSPIKKLKNAMTQGQKDKLWVRCEPLEGEMGALSDSFNGLMERVELLIDEATSNEQEKARLAYEILQSKINPHFLYNTLNAVRYKADMIGAQSISHALESLASLLRFTIKCTDEVISFKTELEQLENYLQIMRIRYGDEIEFDFDIDEECFHYKCLKFLIQPMAENCFVHAFGKEKEENKIVVVGIKCEEDSIVVTVRDNGTGMTKEQMKQLETNQCETSKSTYFGIGIHNVKQRIETLFGPPYYLKIESEWGKYTCVKAVIPKIIVEYEKEMEESCLEREYYDSINRR